MSKIYIFFISKEFQESLSIKCLTCKGSKLSGDFLSCHYCKNDKNLAVHWHCFSPESDELKGVWVCPSCREERNIKTELIQIKIESPSSDISTFQSHPSSTPNIENSEKKLNSSENLEKKKYVRRNPAPALTSSSDVPVSSPSSLVSFLKGNNISKNISTVASSSSANLTSHLKTSSTLLKSIEDEVKEKDTHASFNSDLTTIDDEENQNSTCSSCGLEGSLFLLCDYPQCTQKYHPICMYDYCTFNPQDLFIPCSSSLSSSSYLLSSPSSNSFHCPRHSCGLCGKSETKTGSQLLSCPNCPFSSCSTCHSVLFNVNDSKSCLFCTSNNPLHLLAKILEKIWIKVCFLPISLPFLHPLLPFDLTSTTINDISSLFSSPYISSESEIDLIIIRNKIHSHDYNSLKDFQVDVNKLRNAALDRIEIIVKKLLEIEKNEINTEVKDEEIYSHRYYKTIEQSLDIIMNVVYQEIEDNKIVLDKLNYLIKKSSLSSTPLSSTTSTSVSNTITEDELIQPLKRVRQTRLTSPTSTTDNNYNDSKNNDDSEVYNSWLKNLWRIESHDGRVNNLNMSLEKISSSTSPLDLILSKKTKSLPSLPILIWIQFLNHFNRIYSSSPTYSYQYSNILDPIKQFIHYYYNNNSNDPLITTSTNSNELYKIISYSFEAADLMLNMKNNNKNETVSTNITQNFSSNYINSYVTSLFPQYNEIDDDEEDDPVYLLNELTNINKKTSLLYQKLKKNYLKKQKELLYGQHDRLVIGSSGILSELRFVNESLRWKLKQREEKLKEVEENILKKQEEIIQYQNELNQLKKN